MEFGCAMRTSPKIPVFRDWQKSFFPFDTAILLRDFGMSKKFREGACFAFARGLHWLSRRHRRLLRAVAKTSAPQASNGFDTIAGARYFFLSPRNGPVFEN